MANLASSSDTTSTPAPFFFYELQYRNVGKRFGRILDFHIGTFVGSFQIVDLVHDGVGIVNIKWCSELLRDFADVQSLDGVSAVNKLHGEK